MFGVDLGKADLKSEQSDRVAEVRELETSTAQLDNSNALSPNKMRRNVNRNVRTVFCIIEIAEVVSSLAELEYNP